VLQSITKCDEAALAATLRDIRLFVAAYEERSFTAAAAREHATQSGVSQHIRNLEDTLGVKLFSRNKAEVAPTPAGDSFYQRCLEVLRSHEMATRTVKQYAAGLTGEIVVGLMPTMTRCTLAPALSAFVDTHPNMVVRIIEGYSAALTQQVRAGVLDFAIVPAFSGMPGLKSRLFLRTPEVLVSGASSPFEHLTRVCLASIGPLKLVLPSKANTRRNLIETYCASNGVAVARILELDAMLGTLDFVARTNWMTILPGIMMAVDDPGGRLKVNPIHRPEFMLDLVLIEPSRRPMSEAASVFLELLQTEAARLNERWDKLDQLHQD
jgi:LysR family nitrogen assimilation transcriptional regulator